MGVRIRYIRHFRVLYVDTKGILSLLYYINLGVLEIPIYSNLIAKV